jgi:hypothetical protein
MISHFAKPAAKKPPKRKLFLENTLDANNLVFEKPIFLQNRSIYIEIFLYPQDVRVQAMDVINEEVFRLALNHEEAFEIIGPDYDWEVLTKALTIEGESLMLLVRS